MLIEGEDGVVAADESHHQIPVHTIEVLLQSSQVISYKLLA
jgi:hypothetical protein